MSTDAQIDYAARPPGASRSAVLVALVGCPPLAIATAVLGGEIALWTESKGSFAIREDVIWGVVLGSAGAAVVAVVAGLIGLLLFLITALGNTG